MDEDEITIENVQIIARKILSCFPSDEEMNEYYNQIYNKAHLYGITQQEAMSEALSFINSLREKVKEARDNLNIMEIAVNKLISKKPIKIVEDVKTETTPEG